MIAAAGRDEVRGVALVLVAMLLFAAMDGIAKHLLASYSPVQLLWLRYLMSVPLALLLTLPSAPARALWHTDRPRLHLLRAAVIVVEMLLVMAAFASTPLGDVHAVLAATPLVVTALSVPLLSERVGPHRWTAVAAGFLGVLVMVRPGLVAVTPGILAALASIVLYALFQILTRIAVRTDRAATSFFLQFLLGTVLLTPLAPFFWRPLDTADLLPIAAIAALGAMGHYAFTRALQLAPAVLLQPFTYTLLVWAMVIGWLVFGDLPSTWTIGGATIVVGAGLYAAWREARRAHAASPPSS